MAPDNKPMPGPNETLNQRNVVVTSIPVPRAYPSSPNQEHPTYRNANLRQTCHTSQAPIISVCSSMELVEPTMLMIPFNVSRDGLPQQIMMGFIFCYYQGRVCLEFKQNPLLKLNNAHLFLGLSKTSGCNNELIQSSK